MMLPVNRVVIAITMANIYKQSVLGCKLCSCRIVIRYMMDGNNGENRYSNMAH